MASAMVVEVNLPPVGRGLAHQLNSSARDFARTIASLVALERREHSRQALLLLLGLRLLVGAIEIFRAQRRRFGQPLQQFGELGRECVRFGGDEEHHADRQPIDHQRKGRARPRAIALDDLMKGRAFAGRSRKSLLIAGLPRTERRPADPAPYRMRLAGRNLQTRALSAVGPAEATIRNSRCRAWRGGCSPN